MVAGGDVARCSRCGGLWDCPSCQHGGEAADAGEIKAALLNGHEVSRVGYAVVRGYFIVGGVERPARAVRRGKQRDMAGRGPESSCPPG